MTHYCGICDEVVDKVIYIEIHTGDGLWVCYNCANKPLIAILDEVGYLD